MSSETTGKADFKVGCEIYQTWYMICGDLKNAQHRPLVAMHGGPGMTHDYMLPHKEIYTRGGRPVIFYDQLGNGASSLCPGVPKDFWTPKLFMDELDNLLKALCIDCDFDLLGHSWGGMLAGQYAATRTPNGLKRLIIADSPASIELASRGTNYLLDQFPKDFAEMIRKHEADGTTDAPEYIQGCMQFNKKHFCTLDPWPQELVTSVVATGNHPTVSNAMMGPAKFNVIGTLRSWSIVDILHRIPYPTMLISTPLDESQECAVLPFFTNIPKVKWVELQNSTHLAMFEEPEKYFKVILDFLETVPPA
ncbi:Alpha/Beta hydrolase protein [Flammula alnicola]|nr:Alpha/Beta hydrolase protein [Flammula alnicola]